MSIFVCYCITISICLAICRVLSLGESCPTVFVILYSCLLSMGLTAMHLCTTLTGSKSLASFMLSSASFYTLCTSVLWTHNSIHLFVMSSMSSSPSKSHFTCPNNITHILSVLLMLYHILCNHILLFLSACCPSILWLIHGFFS